MKRGIDYFILMNFSLVNRFSASSAALQPKRSSKQTAMPMISMKKNLFNAEAEGMERGKMMQKLTSEVVQEMAVQHHITYDIYNICELSANMKLSKFAISVLKDICGHLGIDITDICVKRKQPYIDRLNRFCDSCVCRK